MCVFACLFAMKWENLMRIDRLTSEKNEEEKRSEAKRHSKKSIEFKQKRTIRTISVIPAAAATTINLFIQTCNPNTSPSSLVNSLHSKSFKETCMHMVKTVAIHCGCRCWCCSHSISCCYYFLHSRFATDFLWLDQTACYSLRNVFNL